ncbi:hypothetical protein BCR33DRAFT_847840 [Rhizoclosmatium globosum]|uniref:Uncharacterized protein n=1 Tax=Rhizoclosmatium globosum TaxID=329046 RepID=A0A1Y2CQ90_9FUNG|nr:hypothetical protein HDU79_009535 [Rhizoclosmatium sp. JEL0117]ORY49198.1 hypothetical protein BCR33DRAFT_847840 [Rhizoclosmatium globosum]|eukprot:ORY49198.1 hypothetical protein BCR33DRAFT_847840 [Rhizoclosmatium globosum]
MSPRKKYLGARPDPHPEIPAAGETMKHVPVRASECLDHGDRTINTKRIVRRGDFAHIPGKLPLNITSLTEKARPMTHGVQYEYGPSAGEVLFPKQSHPILQEAEKRREKIYHRVEHQALGQSIDHHVEFPEFCAHPDFKFGMSSFEDVSVREIMYPPPHVPTENDEKIRKQYLVSHWSYGPGEIRTHYGDFKVPDHKLLPDNHDNNGLRVKEALYWTEESFKARETKLSSKRLAEFRRRTQPEIGKVHDPLKETLSHLPEDYSFGISFPQDAYHVCDLLGSGPAAQADMKEKRRQEEEDEKRRLAEANDPSIPKPKCGRRFEAQAKRELYSREPAKKITTIPYESNRTEKNANQFVYGLPTVLHRKPGYMKRLADNNNYGDELDTKSLLSPTPRNMLGEDFLNQFIKNMHVDAPEKEQPRPRLPPARVRPSVEV